MADMLNQSTKVEDGDLDADSQLTEAKKELELWKSKVEKADDIKSRLRMEQLDEDDAKQKAKQEMEAWVKKQDTYRVEYSERLTEIQKEILERDQFKQDLQDKLKRCKDELKAKRAECTSLKQKFKICAEIQDTEVNFSSPVEGEEEGYDNSQPIKGVFTISQKSAVRLRGGQALITFEEEKVASKILKVAKCSVSCEGVNVEVKPKKITMEPAVKFEIHLDVSRKQLKFSNVPPALPDERMKDRLEMSFSRPSRGGGEVEGVEYDRNTGTGRITFLHPDVAENLMLTVNYPVDLDSRVNARLAPVYKSDLRRFQTFCGLPKRTILLDDIKDIADEEDMQDHLEIHFQKPSNYGGEIENIKYISGKKTLQAFFCEDVMKEED